jgi:hypothetical protein
VSLRKCCDICDRYMDDEDANREGCTIESVGQELVDKLEKLIPGFDGFSEDIDICDECIVEVVVELRKRRKRPVLEEK